MADSPCHGREPWLDLLITPEPDPDERGALIAALTVYLVARAGGPRQDNADLLSRWATTGRRAAVQALANRPRMGWGREHPGR